MLVVERVDVAGESSGGSVGCRQRRGGVVRQSRVDRRRLVNRCPVRRDEAGKRRVGRRESRCGDNRGGAGGGGG